MNCRIFEKNTYNKRGQNNKGKKRNVEETNNIGRRKPKYIIPYNREEELHP